MRWILCIDCASRFDLHPEDEANGLVMRKTLITNAKRSSNPEENKITITSGTETSVVHIPDDEVICDGCSENVYGQSAVAVSMWHRDDGEMDRWEDNFKG